MCSTTHQPFFNNTKVTNRLQFGTSKASTRTENDGNVITMNKPSALGEDKKIPKAVRIKMKEKQPVIPDANSDSDFEDPHVHPDQGPTDRKKASMNKKKDKKAKQHRDVVGIRTKTSPMILHQTIDDLNNKQIEAVKEMGLGSLLNMTVDGIPSKLGFFVVNNLDTNSMQLHLKVDPSSSMR
ncbi:hypothetical protein L6452_16525 [Arctium lappa]|uniref:Uncharacterized protein n=2 Tax=Arctium lappa TaxID=4217 RepID=A0ACB9C0X4_ARCLA|nr:hypothetical protein L6452_16519 [Arctium lappa]KAI3727903.1 hypothetical protein L6452_16525 [Arctium lappa]